MTEDEAALLDCFATSSCQTFSHDDHVHVAWLLLRSHPLPEAIRIFAQGALALATERGHPEYYHETVTWAYMILINERMQLRQMESWEAFRDCHPELLKPNQYALRAYYQKQTLESEFARKTFVLPDAGLHFKQP